MTQRKILVSPGYGAGWSTWNDDDLSDDFLFDEKLIEAIERGDDKTEAVLEFVERMKKKHGDKYFCVLGASQLEVETVSGPFKVNDYDGFESLSFRDSEDWH